jgi:hypothetical protein
VPAVNAVIELVNIPVPVLSVVLVLNAVVGPDVVLQHTPRAVIIAPPSLVIFPPLVAVVLSYSRDSNSCNNWWCRFIFLT